MKTKLIRDFKYDGVSFKILLRKKSVDVEIVGVNIPVDPGMVVIKMLDGSLKNVPTFVLKDCPTFDFSAMLSDEQKKLRKKYGILIGTGSNKKQTLLPLQKCKLIRRENNVL